MVANPAPRVVKPPGEVVYRSWRSPLLLVHTSWRLTKYHERNISPSIIETLTHEISFPENWLDSVDAYRPVFAEATRKVDGSLDVETPSNVAHDLRIQVLRQLSPGATLGVDASTVVRNRPEARCERFLDSEIIAIYW